MAARGIGAEWQRAQVVLAGTAVAAVTIGALYWARSIFIPLALAVFLTFVFSPVVAWFERRRLGRVPSVLVVVGLALLVTGGLGAVMASQIVALSGTLPDRRTEIVAKLTQAKEALFGTGESRFGALVTDVSEVLAPKPPKADPSTPQVVIQEPGPGWIGQVESFASPAVEIVGQAAFAFLLTVFMLLKREDLRNRMIRLTGHGKVTTTTKAVDDASRRVSKFLLTQLMLNAAFAVVVLVALMLLGVKYAVLWAVIAFFMRYVPYVGTWIGVLPPALYVLAVSDGWGMTITVLAVFLGLELICNNVFEPMLYGPSMGLSEVAQLVAAGFWAFLWGPIGLILSGPLTVCLLVLGKHVARFQYLDVLLGDEPVLAPRVAFYQRLAARDQDEASQIALAEVQTADPADVFDRVLVPALCLAKRDHADGDLGAPEVAFVTHATREIGEEVAEAKPMASDATEVSRARVLVAPARDELDEAACELFARTLDPLRWDVELVTDELLAAELLERIEATDPAAVVIASLPPGGVAHTRYLVTRIRSRFPELKLIVGRWGRGEDFPADTTAGGADWVDATLADTRKRLAEWHSVLTATAAPAAAVIVPAGVGTEPALIG